MALIETHKENTPVEIFFLYVGNREVESVHKTLHTLDNDAVFKKHDIANMIKKHKHLNNTKYKIISLLRFHITVNAEELLLMNDSDIADFLHVERHIDDMSFSQTSGILQFFNSVFFVLSRDHPIRNKQNDTRRIIFNDKFRKTRRGKKT